MSFCPPDNFAVGYFRKQGFTSRISLPRDRWLGSASLQRLLCSCWLTASPESLLLASACAFVSTFCGLIEKFTVLFRSPVFPIHQTAVSSVAVSISGVFPVAPTFSLYMASSCVCRCPSLGRYIKDYDGGTLMECRISNKVNYLKLSALLDKQRKAAEDCIEESSKKILMPGLDIWKVTRSTSTSL